MVTVEMLKQTRDGKIRELENITIQFEKSRQDFLWQSELLKGEIAELDYVIQVMVQEEL